MFFFDAGITLAGLDIHMKIERKTGNSMMVSKWIVWMLAMLIILGCTCGAQASVCSLPLSMQVVREAAFYGDISLDQVILPEGIRRIESMAFRNSSLKTINLPDSLEYIADDAFDGPEKVNVTAATGSYAYSWAVRKGYLTGFEDHFALQGRNKGPCGKLLGDAMVIVVLVGTPEHPWNDAKRNEVYNTSFSSCRIMNENAASYGANLNLTCGFLEYDIPYEYSSGLEWYWYIIREIFHRNNMAEVASAYRASLGKDEVPIVFMFNSWDTSHTYMVRNPDSWNEEFCVIFCDTDGIHDNYLTHEVYHLYGAIDLYDYNGEGIQSIAQRYFPNSNMLGVTHEIDDLNAYLMGWTNTPSAKAKQFLEEIRGRR